MNDQDYKLEVETKHQQRQERIAREAQEKAELEAAERIKAREIQAMPAVEIPDPRHLTHLREVAERARRGETEKNAEPMSGPMSLQEDKARWMRELVHKYHDDPTGIRLVPELQNVCVFCGSRSIESVEGVAYRKVCMDCSRRWDARPCWNCKSPIDSRDPANPQCEVCGMFRCAECDACDSECTRYQAVLESAATA